MKQHNPIFLTLLKEYIRAGKTLPWMVVNLPDPTPVARHVKRAGI